MNRQLIQAAAVRKDILVKASPARAFEIFTGKMGRWWPASHNTQPTAITDVIIEPRAGGRWFSRHEGGQEAEWGKVIAWEPPNRLLLAWQLNAEFKYDPEFITEVEVRFVAEGEGTRVLLEHRNLERYGEAAERVRRTIDSPDGWSGLLTLFAGAADG
jgi:uncharacterized protein YndB with AHSA1/START domain